MDEDIRPQILEYTSVCIHTLADRSHRLTIESGTSNIKFMLERAIGSLTTYKVAAFIVVMGVRTTGHGVILGRGAVILSPAQRTVLDSIYMHCATQVVAAMCRRYARTWASCCLGRMGAGILDSVSLWGVEMVLLPKNTAAIGGSAMCVTVVTSVTSM